MSRIVSIKARQVLDNNGRPVAEVDVRTEKGALGRAGASTGSSVGKNESYVLRDGDPGFFAGLSVIKAIKNIEKIIAPALIGMDVERQDEIDRVMIGLDGTRLKTKLGGNAIYAVSVAVARASAAEKGEPLYLSMAKHPIRQMMIPSSCMLYGGSFNGKNMAFQELMIIPYNVSTMQEAVQIIFEIFHWMKQVIPKFCGKKPVSGNRSGWTAPTDDPIEAFSLIEQAVEELGYSNKVVYALDCAASEFYDAERMQYRWRGSYIDRAELLGILEQLTRRFPFAYIEDPLQEEDYEGFAIASKQLNSLIVGDDLLCSSLDRLEKADKMNAVSGMVFKPNQAGTITEALEAAAYAREHDMLVIPSGRSGGTLDTPEKELGVAIGAEIVKTGAPRTASCAAGFNFLLRTAEESELSPVDISRLKQFAYLF